MQRVNRLAVDHSIDMLGNLLLAGIFVSQNVAPGENVKITLPNSVFSAVSRADFNRCFSDLLIDFGFRDENLDIAVLQEDSFIFKVG